ncbi:hypothetical protein FGO68_gene2535 [Halteria grandinella]|uniref:Uncharacterized protein n=1 Tax=Halteria grandinella TaxID=5974 RepID=A0A8J8P4Q8_HALGN|nr:hypothetical protein FGO68_gene2535 [Halteria grandinella]
MALISCNIWPRRYDPTRVSNDSGGSIPSQWLNYCVHDYWRVCDLMIFLNHSNSNLAISVQTKLLSRQSFHLIQGSYFNVQ